MKTVFILDDEPSILDALALWFERRHYQVKTFTTSFSLLQTLMVEKPSALLMDIHLSGDDGRQLCMLIKAKYHNRLPVILFSAAHFSGLNFQQYEADAFVEKPFSLQALKNVISSYVD